LATRNCGNSATRQLRQLDNWAAEDYFKITREAHDHLGLKVNPAVVNHHSAANGFTNTDFPHFSRQTDWRRSSLARGPFLFSPPRTC
jgi:hypothetical protein